MPNPEVVFFVPYHMLLGNGFHVLRRLERVSGAGDTAHCTPAQDHLVGLTGTTTCWEPQRRFEYETYHNVRKK